MSKIVEWKNTAFDWCIDRDFSIFVKNRCIFFHALAERYIKIMNFAKKFCAPERIIVLYLYGTIKNTETLKRKIGEANDQFAVILIPVSDDCLKSISERDELLKRMKRQGVTKEAAKGNIERCERAIKAGDIQPDFTPYISDLNYLETLDQGDKAEARIKADQHGEARLYSNFSEERKILRGADHETVLMNLIQRIYPFGVEANAPTETGAKMAAIKKMVSAAFQGIETELTMQCCGSLSYSQLSIFDTGNAGAVQMLDDIQRYVSDHIRERNYISVSELIGILRKPPYGMYDCNYYSYILALGLKAVTTSEYRVYDGLTAFGFNRYDALVWLKSPMGIVFRENSVLEEMNKAISKIFEIEPRDSFIDTLHSVRNWCERHLQTPLGIIDRRWYGLLSMSESIYDSKTAEIYKDWICNQVEEHRKAIYSIQEIVYKRYRDKRKVDLYYRFYYVKNGAVGWLWSPESFWERMDCYMKSCVCRECGREIESKFKDGSVYSCDGFDGELLKFTKKEVIGLNKKLLGRYQEEFFCIPCLAEVLDTTPEHLHEKIHTFRVQGCQLF